MPGKRVSVWKGRDIFHLRFKVTLQTFGFGLFSPWSCHYWRTVSPKNSPSFFLVFNHFIQSIPNSFQTACVTLSNTRLLQDVKTLKVNTLWISRALVDSFNCLPTWLLYVLLAGFFSHPCIHVSDHLSFNHPSAIYLFPNSLHLTFTKIADSF